MMVHTITSKQAPLSLGQIRFPEGIAANAVFAFWFRESGMTKILRSKGNHEEDVYTGNLLNFEHINWAPEVS